MKLRPYQEEDVKFLINHKQCGVFSEQRTGKTPTVITALTQQNLEKILIVCPNSIVYNWELECTLWSNLPIEVITDTDAKATDFRGIRVVNYEKIRSKKKTELLDSLVAWNPQGVVIDEAHRMKDRKSLTYLALSRFKKTPIKYALTGTPCTNNPWDIWSILNWLQPKTYTSYWNFINDYFYQAPVYVGRTIYHQPIAFKTGKDKYLQAQLSTFCVQRKRKDVMEWLTDAEIMEIPLKPSVAQASIIRELEKWYEYKNIICKSQLDLMIRIRQICNDPHILDINKTSPKTEWLKSYIADYADEENILIFSNSKKYLRILQNILNVPLICGDTDAKERRDIVTNFQANGGILLLQTQACKEGLTLDNADTSIFLDVYPPSADYQQAKDRMIATTEERDKPKKLIKVYMKDTLDEKAFKAVERNIELSAFVNDYSVYLNKLHKEIEAG